ncbi:MAG TPA: hypothetical protein PKA70_12435 [Saprospiraceae bacterium]|nr:hypothetical protein [Saprospiraceae bacterium]
MLRTMSADEFRYLRKALKSPIWNTDPSLEKLYAYLKKYYPHFQDAHLSDEKVFATVYSTPYDDYKLRRLLSAFYNLVMKYLTFLELDHRPKLAQKLKIKVLERRNIYSQFEKETQERIKVLEEMPFRDVEYYGEMLELYYDYYFHPLTQKHTLSDIPLRHLSDYIDRYFALIKLRIGSELKNRENLFSENYDMRLMDELDRVFQQGLIEEGPIFKLYYHLFELYKPESNYDTFLKLEQIFFDSLSLIRHEDCLLVFQQLLNYIIQQINSGEAQFYPDLLQMYQIGLEKDFLIDQGRISEATFSNIVMVGCNEKAFDWTQQFIVNFESYLDESVRQDTYTHSLVLLHYYKKEYEQAWHMLNEYTFSEAFELRTRMVMIRLLFEQFMDDSSYFEVLMAQLQAFEKYLSRNNLLSKNKKEVHYNLIWLLKKLAIAIEKGDKPQRLKVLMQDALDQNKPMVLKNWVDEVIIKWFGL